MSLSINKRQLLVNHKFLLRCSQQDTNTNIKRRCKVLLREKCKPVCILAYSGKQFIIDFFNRFNTLMLSINSHDFDDNMSYYFDFYKIHTLCQITRGNLISVSVDYAVSLYEKQLYKLLFIDMLSNDSHIIDFREYLKFKHGNTGIINDIMVSPKRRYAITRMIEMAKENCQNTQNLRPSLVKDLVSFIKTEKLIDFLCESGGQLVLQSKTRLKKFCGFIDVQELLKHFSRCLVNENFAKLVKYAQSIDMEFLLVMLCIHIDTWPKYKLTELYFAKTYPLLFYVMTGNTYQFNELLGKKDCNVGDLLLHTLRLENAKN